MARWPTISKRPEPGEGRTAGKVRVRVRLSGIEPRKRPGPEGGQGFVLEVEPGAQIRNILSLFGLKETGLSFLLNGRAVGADQPLAREDELRIVLIAMGG